jgi:hypothetical protein
VTLTEIYDMLAATGYPVAYRQFVNEQQPPFICYLFDRSADMYADDSNYHSISDYDIELYTNAKDPAAEATVESQLRVTGLLWSKSEAYIESERMYEVIYRIRA